MGVIVVGSLLVFASLANRIWPVFPVSAAQSAGYVGAVTVFVGICLLLLGIRMLLFGPQPMPAVQEQSDHTRNQLGVADHPASSQETPVQR
jgi:hypothetical protein